MRISGQQTVAQTPQRRDDRVLRSTIVVVVIPTSTRPRTHDSPIYRLDSTRIMVLAAFFDAVDRHAQRLQGLLGQELSESPSNTALVVGSAVAIPVALALWQWTKASSKTEQRGTRKVHRLKSALPFFGDTKEIILKSPVFHDWLYSIAKEFNGEPVLLTALGRPDLVLLSSVEAFEECFKTRFENFPKGPSVCENMEGLVGEGIFAVDHGKWVHQRKTASNLFTARTIRDGMATTVRKHTETLRRILQEAGQRGESVDLYKLFNRLTIEAFAEIGFGIEMNCLEAEEEHPFQIAFDSAQRTIIQRFVRPAPFWKLQRFLGVGAEGQLQRDTKIIDDTVLTIIRDSLARRERGEVKREGGMTDIVSLFLDNYDKSPDSKEKEFDPKYLRDIVVSFLIAGRDTTAQALSWFFFAVSTNPHVVKKIREEIAQHLPGLLDGSLSTPSMEEIGQLTYLEAALKETLRLYPSVPFNTKHVQEDIVLSDGTFLRKDSTVVLPSYTLGRMTTAWGDDALEFKPERFIDSETGKIINFQASKFIAFNAGPRLCLGMSLAMMELKIVVASLVSQLDIQVLPDQDITYDFSLTMPVRGEMLARVSPATV